MANSTIESVIVSKPIAGIDISYNKCTTLADVLAALAAAGAVDIYAVSGSYNQHLEEFVITLSNGGTFVLPASLLLPVVADGVTITGTGIVTDPLIGYAVAYDEKSGALTITPPGGTPIVVDAQTAGTEVAIDTYNALGGGAGAMVTTQALLDSLAQCCPDDTATIPDSAFADPANPTEVEVQIWIVANGPYAAGTQIIYPGAGTVVDPDYVWLVAPNGAAANIESPTAIIASPVGDIVSLDVNGDRNFDLAMSASDGDGSLFDAADRGRLVIDAPTGRLLDTGVINNGDAFAIAYGSGVVGGAATFDLAAYMSAAGLADACVTVTYTPYNGQGVGGAPVTSMLCASVIPLAVALTIADPTVALMPGITIDALCTVIDYAWEIRNLVTSAVYVFAGAPGAAAGGEAVVSGGTYDAPLIDWEATGGSLCQYEVIVTVTDSCGEAAQDSALVQQTELKQVLVYVGADQVVTAPACATKMVVKAWGAGGGSQSNNIAFFGGAGGYTQAEFGVSGGEQFAVVVGQGGLGNNAVGAYGFGGPNSGDGGNGGGLSGVFTTAGVVVDTDQARALVVAGGGGGADYSSTRGRGRGGNGNDPVFSGGEAGMLGISDDTRIDGNAIRFVASDASGGGGYFGGKGHFRNSVVGSYGTLPYGGEGGSGFVAASATSGSMQFTPEINRNPPNMVDADYGSGIAVGGAPNGLFNAGGNGRVVIYWQA